MAKENVNQISQTDQEQDPEDKTNTENERNRTQRRPEGAAQRKNTHTDPERPFWRVPVRNSGNADD